MIQRTLGITIIVTEIALLKTKYKQEIVHLLNGSSF